MTALRTVAAIRSRRGLVGLLTAEAVSLTGTRLSAIALPWFVLVSSGSATRTGLVAFCEMGPYVVAKAVTGPLVDRVGPRRVSILGDVASAALVGAIPLLHAFGVLPLSVLLALVALLGTARGPADSAKSALIPDVVEAAQVPLERATGLSGTIERLASTVGPAAAGAVVAVTGPLTALMLDATSFAVAAVVIAATAPRHRAAEGAEESDGYVQQFRDGLAYLRTDRLLRTIVGMVGVTNLLDTAMFAVLLPVWARDSGRGPAEIGLVVATMSGVAVGGSLLAAGFAHRLPRRTTYLLGYLVGGAPRFIVLAFGAPLWLVLAANAVAGAGLGFLNPILGAVIFERIPRPLIGRVNALIGSLSWAGIPFGGLVGGALVALVGLAPGLLVCGTVYFLVTTLPGLRREWREMDEARLGSGPV
ncbi:MAG TPA: MFS transporter [Actinopolymorphaceae bacterium]|nr:MFS transporter [Actinopolymorphaceae bacterium]